MSREPGVVGRALAAAAAAAVLATTAGAQRPTLSAATKAYVAVDTTVVALIHARIVDGTGGPRRDNQTVVIKDGRIDWIGDDGKLTFLPGTLVLDMSGKTVLPGLVMVHEHLFYPTGSGTYANLAESFTRLYLAGGVTAIRTAGNMNGFSDFAIARAIERGEKPGPWIDATAPYLNGPGLPIGQVRALTDAVDARRQVIYWSEMGARSFKAYMHITRDELAAVIDEAHKRGLKVTGHLCSITYREAAALGIDNLEHGFFAATDFVKDKKADECPAQNAGQRAVVGLVTESAPFTSLVDALRGKVALTSTLTVFETLTPGRPLPPGLDVLEPQLKEQFERRWQATQHNDTSIYRALFPLGMKMELQFYRRGGVLLGGTDPTAGGGVIPGFANQRQIELLVEAGFWPVEAIKVGTLNGAKYLGIDSRTGSVQVGKQADLMIVTGDPSERVADIRNVYLVFKQGVGYDPAKLINSVKGKVGLF